MKAHHTLLVLALAAPLALLTRAPGATGGQANDSAIPSGPTADEVTTARYVYGLLSDRRYAYRPRQLDDAL